MTKDQRKWNGLADSTTWTSTKKEHMQTLGHCHCHISGIMYRTHRSMTHGGNNHGVHCDARLEHMIAFANIACKGDSETETETETARQRDRSDKEIDPSDRETE